MVEKITDSKKAEVVQYNPEIAFYGDEVDIDIREGFKPVTIRMPREAYDEMFTHYRENGPFMAKATFNSGKPDQDIIVWGMQKFRIKDIPELLLELDGYGSPKKAVKDLRNYYEGITKKTEVYVIGIFDPTIFHIAGYKLEGYEMTEPADLDIILGNDFPVMLYVAQEAIDPYNPES